MASIDGEEVHRRLAVAPARSVGVALVLIAVLAYVGLTGAAVSALGRPGDEPGMRPQWVVDYALGTPALLLGGVLLWRRVPLGYVAASGLLLVSGLNGLAFAASAVLDGLLAGRSIESAVVVVHLVIGGVSFALLAFFDGRAAGRAPVGRPARARGVRRRPDEPRGRSDHWLLHRHRQGNPQRGRAQMSITIPRWGRGSPPV